MGFPVDKKWLWLRSGSWICDNVPSPWGSMAFHSLQDKGKTM